MGVVDVGDGRRGGQTPPEISEPVYLRLEAVAEIANVAQEVEDPVSEVNQAGAEFDALASEFQNHRDQAK
jgi:hypothetical protein